MSMKSQSAMEFIVLSSFLFLVIVGFFAISSSKLLDVKEEANRKVAEDIAEFAYREIEIATSVNNGYKRVFYMPQNVNSVDYNIAVVDNRELIVNYLGYEHIKFLPSNVTGNITRGFNVISKENGTIFINASSVQFPSSLINLIMRNNLLNVIRFEGNGNVVLKGVLNANYPNPPVTASDEFIIKDISGNAVAVINLDSGNMFIKGSLFENQQTLSPSPSSNDFIVKDANGNVISYIDESGNFYLKGTLTQNGNP